jgi:type IV secretory pathway VirB10-like protein
MDGLFKFIAGCGLRLRYCRWHAVIAALLAFALGLADSGFGQPARPKENTPATFQLEVRKHVSPKRPEEPIDMNPLQTPAGEVAPILPWVTMAPTRSSFLASRKQAVLETRDLECLDDDGAH